MEHQEAPAGGAAPPRPGKRLYRHTEDKMIAGVASGLADYVNVDPVIVRVAFVILALVGGVGLIAYGALWWLVPPTHEVSNAGQEQHAPGGSSGPPPGWRRRCSSGACCSWPASSGRRTPT